MTPSTNYSIQPSTFQIQRSFSRPTPYPPELAIRNVRAFQARHPSEVVRGQFVHAGVIRVCCYYSFILFLTTYQGVSDVAITGQRDLRRRAMPSSLPLSIGAPIPNVASVTNQVAVTMPQGPPAVSHMVVTPPTSPLDKEQQRLIVSEAKSRLRHFVLCEIPFPSTSEMHTHATRVLETSIDAVLQGLNISLLQISSH